MKLALSALFAAATIATHASAMEPASVTPAAPTAPSATRVAPDAPVPAVQAPKLKNLAITLNPITLGLLGRYGANVEFLPSAHHALHLNPYFMATSAESGNVKTTYSNYGAEVGYRYYTASDRPAGFFIGPTVQYMHVGVTTEGGSGKGEISYTSYGAGVDLGGKVVMDNGFTLGGGFGLAYLKSSVDASAGSDSGTLLKFEGVLPRFLFDVGYAFDL